MTAHIDIADSEIDPESPGTTTVFTKLRDNPIATYEGNNPTKIVYAALNITGGVVASDFTDFTTGTYPMAESAGAVSSTNTTMEKYKEIYCPTAGTYSVSFDMKATNTGSSVTGRIYVDDVATGTNRTTNSISYVTYTQDITITAGQLIQVYSAGIGTNYVFIKSFKLSVSNPLNPVIIL